MPSFGGMEGPGESRERETEISAYTSVGFLKNKHVFLFNYVIKT